MSRRPRLRRPTTPRKRRPRSAGGRGSCDTEPVTYPYLLGHGTENDFVLLPDHDGSVHGDLSPERVRALCDRRAGIGGDGVLRVIQTGAHPSVEPVETTDAEWIKDSRN